VIEDPNPSQARGEIFLVVWGEIGRVSGCKKKQRPALNWALRQGDR
jgi:hypothetical protein